MAAVQLSARTIKDEELDRVCTHLKQLPTFHYLSITKGNNLAYLNALQRLAGLQGLSVERCHNLSDISALQELTSLQRLVIKDCNNIENIDVLRGLENLQMVSLRDCNIPSDISILNNLTNLQELTLSTCPQLSDIRALGELTNLKALSLRTCKDLSDITAPLPVNKAVKNVVVVIVPSNTSSEILDPTEGSLHFPTTAITSEFTPVLRRRFGSAAAMRTNQVDTTAAKTFTQGVAVRCSVVIAVARTGFSGWAFVV